LSFRAARYIFKRVIFPFTLKSQTSWHASWSHHYETCKTQS
jgi:hypothetical protein